MIISKHYRRLLGLLLFIAMISLAAGCNTRKENVSSGKEIANYIGKQIIFDSKGNKLAETIKIGTISIFPNAVENPELVAKKLSELLEIDYQSVLNKATNKQSSIEIIDNEVKADKIELIKRWIRDEKVNGIKIDEKNVRSYIYNNLASHVIGFAGKDSKGLDGIELTYKRYLSDSENGSNITLSIDKKIQESVERYLEDAVVQNKCANGIAIVMKPKTGEILAMAVKPDFNLNKPFEPNDNELKNKWSILKNEEKTAFLQKMWRNKAISDTYEFGSPCKLITASAALEEGLVSPEEEFNDKGYAEVDGIKIKCWRYYNPHGLQTFRQAVVDSCDPVFVEVSQRLGRENFYKYINAFGFQEKTAIDLPGEAKGIFLESNKSKPIDISIMSTGRRFQITPIQLITAISAIANDGKLMKPQLVKEIRDQYGNITEKIEPKVVREVISPKTAEVIKNAMENIVAKGTGKNASVKGYRIAGISGTAEKGLDTPTYIASFVGFAPVENPEVSVLILLDDPKGNSFRGGDIAAPVAAKVFSDVLPYLGIESK